MHNAFQPIKRVLPIKKHTRRHTACPCYGYMVCMKNMSRVAAARAAICYHETNTHEAIPESVSNLFGSQQSTALELILVCERLRHLQQEALTCPHRLYRLSNLLMCPSKSGMFDEPLRQKDRSWCRSCTVGSTVEALPACPRVNISEYKSMRMYA